MEELVLSNLGFVVKVAGEYRHMGVPLEDPIDEGNIGLLVAASRFDPSRGARFTTCAAWWIRRRILQAVAGRVRPIRVPDYQRRKPVSIMVVPLDTIAGARPRTGR